MLVGRQLATELTGKITHQGQRIETYLFKDFSICCVKCKIRLGREKLDSVTVPLFAFSVLI